MCEILKHMTSIGAIAIALSLLINNFSLLHIGKLYIVFRGLRETVASHLAAKIHTYEDFRFDSHHGE